MDIVTLALAKKFAKKYTDDKAIESIAITDVVVNDDYTLTFQISDGSSFTTTKSVRGQPGACILG